MDGRWPQRAFRIKASASSFCEKSHLTREFDQSLTTLSRLSQLWFALAPSWPASCSCVLTGIDIRSLAGSPCGLVKIMVQKRLLRILLASLLVLRAGARLTSTDGSDDKSRSKIDLKTMRAHENPVVVRFSIEICCAQSQRFHCVEAQMSSAVFDAELPGRASLCGG
jgi:hypothetical protein